jgi:hypothetical protein
LGTGKGKNQNKVLDPMFSENLTGVLNDLFSYFLHKRLRSARKALDHRIRRNNDKIGTAMLRTDDLNEW